jgi:hypothetical protein
VNGQLAFSVVAVGLAGCAEAVSPHGSMQADAGRGGVVDAPTGARLSDAPQPDASSALACATSATCPTATSLGQLNGDDGGTVTASGTQAAWLSVRVNEDDSGPLADPMRVLTQLTSPSTSEMFDLFLYVNIDADVVECGTPTGTPATTGASESVELEWGETGTFANGVDDSRTMSIEIRPRAGITCSSSATWQLAIHGGQ